MEMHPIANHETLPDMPSSSNTDHDGRYFTETELGAITAPSGASLIGVEDSADLFTATDVEAALEEVMDKVTPVTYTANSIATPTGTVDLGDVDSTKVINDADTYDVSEVTGSPGWDIRLTYTGITAGHEPNKIQLHLSYNGSAGHVVNFELFNYTGTPQFDVIAADAIVEAGGTLIFYSIDITGEITDYVNGSGEAILRLNHTSNGNINHDVSVDYAVLKDDTSGGGGITDHGSLSGLSEDDHTQYIKDSEFTQDSGFLVGTGAGTFQEETGATLRTSAGLGTGDSPEFTDETLSGTLFVDGITGASGSGYLDLNGSGDYVTVPDAADLDVGTGDFSVSMWFRIDNLGTNAAHHLINKRHNSSPFQGFFAFYEGRNAQPNFRRLVFGFDPGAPTGTNIDSAAVTVNDNNWHHIAITRDGTDLRIYIDGSSANNDDSVGNDADLDGTNPLQIGASRSGGANWPGALDEVMFFKGAAIQSAEVSTIFAADRNAGSYSGTSVASLTMHHRYDDSTADDDVGTNDGTFVDDASTSDESIVAIGGGISANTATFTTGTISTGTFGASTFSAGLDMTGGVISENHLVQTAAGPTNDLDVSDVNIVFIDTVDNNVTIGGFVGGVEGQTLKLAVVDETNNAILEHNEGTGNQDIFLHAGADETITANFGGWILVCDGDNWFETGNST